MFSMMDQRPDPKTETSMRRARTASSSWAWVAAEGRDRCVVLPVALVFDTEAILGIGDHAVCL